jgi:pilus assembly protein CpaF
VTEIMVNGPYDVWVERQGRLYETTVRFIDDSHLRRIINKIVAQVGRRLDESSPMVDARLPDGSRVNAVIAPLSLSGALLTIRKFSRKRLDMSDLIRLGTLSMESVEFLQRCILAELNVLISGGTGSGKTTLLNALSTAIPDAERIVTIEDAAELRLNQRHVLRLEARPKNIEGEGEIPIRELVRNSLRMRPDRIIVGEVRGAEALDMLQAMNTGHDGSLSTVHANTPRDALSRVETMVLMAGYDLPIRAIRQQVASALDLIVHLERLEDGGRRVTAITEVQRMESEVITLQDIFEYKIQEITSERVVVGHLRPTGLRPTFLHKFEKRGVSLPLGLFADGRVGRSGLPSPEGTRVGA